MSTQIRITKWFPEGFAECLQGLSGKVQSEAETIAGRASNMLERGSGFHVEMSNEAKFLDEQYGVTRPVAHVVPNDEESSNEERWNKILSKAVSG
jgi:hypothetical protein